MQKNKIFFRAISIVLSIIIIIHPINVAAAEMGESFASLDGKNGRIPVYCLDNTGNQLWLDVLVENGKLYVKSTSFANKFGYLTAETDDSVQFLQCSNSSEEEYKWTLISDFTINSCDTWISDGKDIIYYKAPYKCIQNEEGIWVPFQFVLKVMGRELCINEGIIIVSKAHEIPNFIINNVDYNHTQKFRVLNRTNEIMRDLGYETKGDSLLAEAIDSENNKYEWLYSNIISAPDVSGGSTEGIDELTTYLVSNVSPENSAMYEMYYELIQMYMSPELMLAGGDVALSFACAMEEDSSDSIQAGKRIVEDSASNIVDSNTPNLVYNNAFINAYSGLTGYNPVELVWEDETIYESLCSSLFTYSGDPSASVFASISYAANFLGPLSNFANNIASIYVDFQCSKNMMAENDFASTKFDNYLMSVNSHGGNSQLVNSLSNRIADYGAYQDEIREKYRQAAIKDDAMGYIDGQIKDATAKRFPLIELFYFGVNYEKYRIAMEDAANERLAKSVGAYKYAQAFADELRRNTLSEKNIDWAYCYYKTDYVANFYYLSVISKNTVNCNEEDIADLRSSIRCVIQEDTYHMAEIRSGINYGLNVSDNDIYNNTYDDQILLNYIEEVNLSVGNSNANINAYGFVATTDTHTFAVDSENGYSIYMSSANGSNRTRITEDASQWLNAINFDGNDYLYYIDSSKNIYVYDVNLEESKILQEGDFSKLMIAYGYVFAIEDGNLYRFNLISPNEVDNKTEIIKGVGKCVAYSDDAIYYINSNQQLFKTSHEGGEVTDLGIRSASFDISNGNIYYSNIDDNGCIYLFNELTKIDTKMSSVENAYCINYHTGMIYFKVDDDVSSSLLYSIVPFVDKAVTRVYSWEGSDDDWGFELSEDISRQFGRNNRRVFNISNGKIYNEGYTWKIVDFPLAGINVHTAIGYLSYRVSKLFE